MKVNLRSAARTNVQYLTFVPVRYSTAEFGRIAGKSAELIRKSYQVNGHYLGNVPVKEANGRLTFDARAVLEACGKIPKTTTPTAIDDFRDNLCAQTGADPFPAHKLASHVLRESPTGDTPRARFGNFVSDLRDFQSQADAFGKRLGALMQDEEDGTPTDWRLFNYYADKIENAADVIVTRLRWRQA